ncbi:MAG: hypothetical protein V7724_10205 [Sediminicola sp.]
MEYGIYILLGVCGLIFVINLIVSKNRGARRKSRKFLDRYDEKNKS